MRLRDRLGAAALLALTLAGSVAAEMSSICDSRALDNASSQYAYRWYAEERYCEGFFDKPRRTELDLISLTRGKLSFDLAASRDLEIHAPHGGLLDGQSIHVRGFGLAPALSVDGRTLAYQMDSVLTAGGHRQWPVARVLGPNALGASQLGLVAWLDGDVGPVYVPVEVRQRSSAADPEAPVLITIRVPGHADWVKACFRPVAKVDLSASQPTVPGCDWRQFGSGISAGETVDIPMPEAAQGLVSVTVKAKVGKRVFSLHEDFYRPAAW